MVSRIHPGPPTVTYNAFTSMLSSAAKASIPEADVRTTVAAPEKILRGAIFLIMIKATHSVGTLSKTFVSICCYLINSYSNTFLSTRWKHTIEIFPL